MGAPWKMALRYENTDAPSEETSSVISRSLSQSNLEDIRQQSQRETQFPGRRQVVGQSRSSPHFVTRDQVGLDDMSSYAGTGNHNYYVSQSIADSTTQVEVNDASFIIPDTNVWNNSIQDENGVVQSVKEQEILSSIQELQRQLIDIRNEKDSWVRDGSKRGGGNEVEEAFPPVDNDAEDRSEVINTVQQESSRIVVVSNRLPVSMQKQKKADGRDVWTYEKTSGGLVSALRAAKENIDFIWVGWVGQFIPESERAAVRQTLVNDFGCVPVFLEVPVLNGYYHGFSNDILWPLFHYEPLPCFRPGVERKFDTSQWESYKRANLIFANAINDILEDGRDMVWIHDYHLMLVPKLLRKLAPKVPIGWFLHVPFPSSDVYRMLPVRRKILEGVLAADLVGFHTYDYMRHFLSSAARILGIESSPKGITTKSGHFCALGVFPIGIEPAFFQRVLERPSCQRRIAELCKRLGHCHILIGIDRLDYIKGMPHKLLAFEYLLRTHPEYHRNIVLIQVGVPSRVQVKEYQKLASQVNELVGRINGTFGTLDYTPIHYIQRPVSTEELCALYNVANACIITSVRDGMNLVSHEYVAMQESPCPASRDGPGMLVLSEFAGAAQSLSGAIRINPWNIGELAAAMHQALSTEKALRELQQKKLHRYVSLHTSSVWARSFLDELVASANNRIENEEQRIQGHNLRHHQKDFIDSSIIDNNAKAHNRPNLSRNERKGSNSDLKHSSKNTSQSEVESKYKKAGETKMNIMTANRSFMVPNMGAVRRRRLRRLPIFKMLQAYKQAGAKRKTGASSAKHIRALILDLDGLLAATGTVPLLSRPSPFVISYLLQLAMNPSNLLIILSGRSRTVLESWLKAPDGSQIDCAICAENGVFFRASAKHNWEYMGLAEELETWKSYVLPMIQFFADRTPGEILLLLSI